MKPLAILLLPFTLSGCFFFAVIPGSVTTSLHDALYGTHGKFCVPSSAQVGERFRMADGSVGVVQKLEGNTPRCPQNQPMRAVIEPEKPGEKPVEKEQAS